MAWYNIHDAWRLGRSPHDWILLLIANSAALGWLHADVPNFALLLFVKGTRMYY